MPYIITMTPRCECGEHHHGSDGTKRAVATIEQARDAAADIIYRQHDGTSHFDHFDAATYMPDTGGSIGPLPNGTVIEVRAVSWPELGQLAGRPYHFAEYGQTIDAYNQEN